MCHYHPLMTRVALYINSAVSPELVTQSVAKTFKLIKLVNLQQS